MPFENLTAFIRHLTSERNYPGNAIKIYRNHDLIYEYASGYADIEERIPYSTSSLVNLYSATKVITCACAMTLFEKGKFIMTDAVQDYIPEFKDIKVRDIDEKGNKNFDRQNAPLPYVIFLQ